MPAGIDIIRGDIAQPLVVTPVVVVFNKGTDGFLQLTRHVVGHTVNLPFYRAMVALYLTVGLGIDLPPVVVPPVM